MCVSIVHVPVGLLLVYVVSVMDGWVDGCMNVWGFTAPPTLVSVIWAPEEKAEKQLGAGATAGSQRGDRAHTDQSPY